MREPRSPLCLGDAWAFEHLLSQVETARKAEPDRAQGLCEKALALYRGPFLQKTEAPWAVARRERLRGAYLHHLLALARALETNNRW